MDRLFSMSFYNALQERKISYGGIHVKWWVVINFVTDSCSVLGLINISDIVLILYRIVFMSFLVLDTRK